MDSRLKVRSFRMKQAATVDSLKRLDDALASWDEWSAAQRMPAETRRHVRKPVLSRRVLEEQQAILEEALSEMEQLWERRN